MLQPEDIFIAARELTAPAERAAFLAKACGEDADLRHAVESLLADATAAAAFFGESSGTETVDATEPSSPAAATFPEGPGTVIGHYQLLELIGAGGMGEVHLAEQREPLVRRVALKIIKLGMDTKEVVARFEAERQALALMDHPNIAKVFDAGSTDAGRPYFVMELVQGLPITRFCDEHQFDTQERLELFLQVCAAVQHAHQKGVIHRDLKPSNILVTMQDGEPAPKVIDFGIAKAIERPLIDKTDVTRDGQILGTLAYMSPEQAGLHGQDVDTRSDIYTLGVLLYELLVGRTPFDMRTLLQEGREAVYRVIREEEPPRPSTKLTSLTAEEMTKVAQRRNADAGRLRSLLCRDLDWIVMRALEKDRDRRFATANALAADLRRHLANEEVESRPPSAMYRLSRTVRRHRLAFAASGAVAAALLIGIGLSTWWGIEANEARNAEAQQTQKANTALATSVRLLDRMDMDKANGYFDQDRTSEGLAHLARVLRRSPSNDVAAVMVLNWLDYVGMPVEVCPPLRHSEAVHSATFSPDGRLVVTASADETARVWNVQTGQPVGPALQHEGPVYYATCSPDGAWVVTESLDATVRGDPAGPLDGTVRVWEVTTGQPINVVRAGVSCGVNFSPDKIWVVVILPDSRSARVWEARSGRPVSGPLQHGGFVNSAALSPDGRWVVTASTDKTAQVWSAESGQRLGPPLQHRDSVTAAAFSPDGRLVVTTSEDQTARVWEAATGRSVAALPHADHVNDVEVSPDGLWVVTASSDKTARVWAADTGQPVGPTLWHDAPVRSARFSPDGRWVATTTESGVARLWRVASGWPVSTPLGHGRKIRAVAFHPDGQWMVTASEEATARVTEVASGRPLFPLSGWLEWDSGSVWLDSGRIGEIRCAAFGPDGLWKVTTAEDKTAQVWEIATGRPVGPSLRHDAFVYSAAVSSDGRWVVLVLKGGTAKLWEVSTGQAVGEPLRHGDSMFSAKFSPDGKWVVTASGDGTARVWETATSRPISKPLRHGSSVASATFSPDGKWIVTASEDKTARVWEAASGRPVGLPLRLDGFGISAAFSPDGRWVVTTSDAPGLRRYGSHSDKTVRVWEAATGRPVGPPLRLVGQKHPAAFSLDGRLVVASSDDGQPPEVVTRHHFRPSLPALIWDPHTSQSTGADWLADLAEAAGGLTVSDTGDYLPTSVSAEAIRSRLAAASSTNDFAHWARWFVADRHTRTINSRSRMTVPEYVDTCLKAFTLDGANRAADLEPANGLVQARLAATTLKDAGEAAEFIAGLNGRLSLTPAPKRSEGARSRAEFLSRHALKLAPERTEVWRVRAEVLRATGDTTNAVQALERAVEFADREVAPWRPLLWKTLADFAQADGQPEPWLGLLESASRRGIADPELVEAKAAVQALRSKK
jgi:WD40 repeat protein/serine/threonine protein kinase